MHVHTGEAFAETEQLTVLGKQLHAGDPAPDFRLVYPDLADLAIRTTSLADTTVMVRLSLLRGQDETVHLLVGEPAMPQSHAQ